MTNEFGMDQEIVRRLVERIIKLEVDQETLKRRVDEPLVGNDIFGNEEAGPNNKILLWNRILRLEEGQQVVQKHVQELFANVMDFELQSRGEPCYLHDQGNMIGGKISANQRLHDYRRYLNRSTHPGLKHLTEYGQPVLRLFWATALLIAIMVCGAASYLSYCHWSSSASSFTYTETPVALGSIPFPAITICPERNIGSEIQLENLLQQCTNWACTRDQFEMLSAAAFLCPSLMQTIPIQSWSNYYNTTTPKFMQELMPLCSEDILSYHWSDGGTELNCTKAFQTVYIDDRVCYSYNMLPASYIFNDNLSPEPVMWDGTGLAPRPRWAPDTLARPVPSDRTIPLHRDAAGEDHKLTIALQRKVFRQTSCADPFQTFQVAIHHPAELPSRSTHQYLRLPLAHSLLIAVTPRLVSTLDARDQECRAAGEPGSGMFRHYSPTKCRIECRARCSVNLCGCVPLYLPRVDNTTKWCGLSHRYCPDTIVPELLRGAMSWESIAKHYRKELRDDLREVITDHLYQYPGQEGLTSAVLAGLRPDCGCQCPPACTELTYHLDTQLVPQHDRNWSNMSEINVYFKEGMDVITASERRAAHNVIDFLAHVGGLVAVVTGVSVLTLLETVYLVTSALLRRQDPGYVSRQTSCLRRRQEWDKTAQTDPIFITDGHLNIGF